MPPQTHRAATTASLLLAMFMPALEMTVVTTAMPSVVGALGGLSHYSWVFTAYLLTATVTVPLFGKLADSVGRKPVLMWGFVLFALGSGLCGAATSMEQLVSFRLLQGIGGGAVQPVVLTIIGDLYTLEERGRVQGLFSTVWVLGALLGPLCGALIIQHLSWPWVFWMNLPVAAVAAAVFIWAFREELERRERSLDLLGALLIAVATGLLLLAVQGTWVLGIPAVLCFLFFLWVEGRVKDPVVPLSLFRIPAMGKSAAIAALFSVTQFGAITFVPLFVEAVLGGTALQGGAMITPVLVSWPVASTLSGRLVPRLGFRPFAVVGMGLATVAALALALLLQPGADRALVMVMMGVLGFGLGMTSTSQIYFVQTVVGWELRGVATATALFCRTLGGTLGVGVMGAVLALKIAGTGGMPEGAAEALLGPEHGRGLPAEVLKALSGALEGGLHVAFWLSFVAAAAGFLITWLLPTDRPTRSEPIPAAEIA